MPAPFSPLENDRQRDQALLLKVAARDQDAYRELYDRLSPILYGLVRRMVFDPKEAEDVLQEAFYQIWTRAKTYDPSRSSAFTWLVMIVRHKAIDRLRARLRSQRTREKAVEWGHFQTVDDVSAGNPAANERHAAVRNALAEIPPEQRDAIGLAFFGGCTHEEVAERLGQPLGTIKARIRRGLLRLRDALKEAA